MPDYPYDEEPQGSEIPQFNLAIQEDTVDARLDSYFLSPAEPRDKLAGIIDCLCRRNYPTYVCEEGIVKTIIKSLFSQRYRDAVLWRFYGKDEAELPIMFLRYLNREGIIEDLNSSGSSFEDVINILRGSDGYRNNEKEIEKLDQFLKDYKLLVDAGWINKKIIKSAQRIGNL